MTTKSSLSALERLLTIAEATKDADQKVELLLKVVDQLMIKNPRGYQVDKRQENGTDGLLVFVVFVV